MRHHHHSWRTVSLIFLAGAVADGVLYLIPRDTALEFLGVGGSLGVLSTSLYLVAALLFGILETAAPRKGDYRGTAVLLTVGIIQWDPTGWLARRATDPGHFFDSEIASGREKVAGAIVVLVLVALVVSFLVRHGKSWWTGLGQGDRVSVFAFVGVVLIPLSLVLDKIQGDMIWQKGYRIRFGPKFAVEVLEETLEFLIPAFFLAAILAGVWRVEIQRFWPKARPD